MDSNGRAKIEFPFVSQVCISFRLFSTYNCGPPMVRIISDFLLFFFFQRFQMPRRPYFTHAHDKDDGEFYRSSGGELLLFLKFFFFKRKAVEPCARVWEVHDRRRRRRRRRRRTKVKSLRRRRVLGEKLAPGVVDLRCTRTKCRKKKVRRKRFDTLKIESQSISMNYKSTENINRNTTKQNKKKPH